MPRKLMMMDYNDYDDGNDDGDDDGGDDDDDDEDCGSRQHLGLANYQTATGFSCNWLPTLASNAICQSSRMMVMMMMMMMIFIIIMMTPMTMMNIMVMMIWLSANFNLKCKENYNSPADYEGALKNKTNTSWHKIFE